MKAVANAIVVAFMFISILAGCSNSVQPDASMLEVGIEELQGIQANEPFIITGYLKNNSKHSWEISHGAGMFTYEIVDAEGNPLKRKSGMLFRNNIGFLTQLKPDEVLHINGEEHRSEEYYTFVIDKPGQYKVRTNVEFRIENKQEINEQKLTSEFYEFSVELSNAAWNAK
ncbi:hypothetical protein [Paenibacillus sp. J2TS4]|uniref:hypothetical protein n=1 Tax=Paenibacillus sp. J2TS4 TaxID=2807194 RepID=UPI001B0B21F8|nr:hypothetical protein [Paenibacillus sp. J2TS4]GIP32140.1 hypothetical protein J2TS4_13500 [Paenibacillus sp. J2TS4]